LAGGPKYSAIRIIAGLEQRDKKTTGILAERRATGFRLNFAGPFL
jgi:hypothetical protein|tara:strand:+ start:888 stop:1022 length:135 start_codon:yes stop_codon:yes gene_type:complete